MQVELLKPFFQEVDDWEFEGGAVSSSKPIEVPGAPIPESYTLTKESWYAVHTRPKHERAVAQKVQEQGIATFLPLITELRRWSDRKKKIELPLFSCYLFTRLLPTNEQRLRVLRVDGALQFVGMRGRGSPIPDDQIEAVRMIVNGPFPISSFPFIRTGQRVRIRNGALRGIEGTLQACNGEQSLIVSVDAIQKSLAVRVEGYDLETV
jgi:transcriptional antiterminator RfaH